MPTEKFEGIAWPHRARLPLGDGWKGECTAPGHEGACPDEHELTICNVGYAKSCPWLPQQRPADAVRFSVTCDRDSMIRVFYICEADHRPGDHGTLEYDSGRARWLSLHGDTRIQRMAECYLDSYLLRRNAEATS